MVKQNCKLDIVSWTFLFLPRRKQVRIQQFDIRKRTSLYATAYHYVMYIVEICSFLHLSMSQILSFIIFESLCKMVL